MKASERAEHREILLQAAEGSRDEVERRLGNIDVSETWKTMRALMHVVSKLIQLERLRGGEGGEE